MRNTGFTFCTIYGKEITVWSMMDLDFRWSHCIDWNTSRSTWKSCPNLSIFLSWFETPSERSHCAFRSRISDPLAIMFFFSPFQLRVVNVVIGLRSVRLVCTGVSYRLVSSRWMSAFRFHSPSTSVSDILLSMCEIYRLVAESTDSSMKYHIRDLYHEFPFELLTIFSIQEIATRMVK